MGNIQKLWKITDLTYSYQAILLKTTVLTAAYGQAAYRQAAYGQAADGEAADGATGLEVEEPVFETNPKWG